MNYYFDFSAKELDFISDMIQAFSCIRECTCEVNGNLINIKQGDRILFNMNESEYNCFICDHFYINNIKNGVLSRKGQLQLIYNKFSEIANYVQKYNPNYF